MKFSTYQVTDQSDFFALKRHINFMSKEEVSVFHFNLLDKNIIHIVFNVRDEYISGTKLVGNQMSIPIPQYVNAFYHPERKVIFIEKLYEQYCSLIVKYLSSISINITKRKFSNQNMVLLCEKYQGHIKKMEMHNYEDMDLLLENVDLDFLFHSMTKPQEILSLLLLCDDTYVSIKCDGTVSIGTSDLNTLIYFIKEFPICGN